jgi:hypothetical protein
MRTCVFLSKKKCNRLNSVILPNDKLNATSNTNYENISGKMRIAQRLRLDGYSQKSNPIARINGGITQFGNFYLGQQATLNYLGRMEGQPGGSGAPPINNY